MSCVMYLSLAVCGQIRFINDPKACAVADQIIGRVLDLCLILIETDNFAIVQYSEQKVQPIKDLISAAGLPRHRCVETECMVVL